MGIYVPVFAISDVRLIWEFEIFEIPGFGSQSSRSVGFSMLLDSGPLMILSYDVIRFRDFWISTVWGLWLAAFRIYCASGFRDSAMSIYDIPDFYVLKLVRIDPKKLREFAIRDFGASIFPIF